MLATVLRLPVVRELPRTRGDCVDGVRPCPHATCRHHLGPERPDWRTDGLASCTLDVADSGGITLDEMTSLLWSEWGSGGWRPLVRERIRQIEEKALMKVRRRAGVLTEFVELRDHGPLPRNQSKRAMLQIPRGGSAATEEAESDAEEAFAAGPVWEGLPGSEDTPRRLRTAQDRVWSTYERHGRSEEMAALSDEEWAKREQAVHQVLGLGPRGKRAIADALEWHVTTTSNVVDRMLERGEIVRTGGKRGPGVAFALPSDERSAKLPASKPVAKKATKPKKPKAPTVVNPVTKPVAVPTIADVSVPPSGGFRVHLGELLVECDDVAQVLALAKAVRE